MVNQEEINGYFLEIIRFLKSEYGYTQEFIVEKAKLGKSAISKIKNGENNVGDKTITKLCGAFEMLNPNFFYGRSPYKTKREELEVKMELALKDAQNVGIETKDNNRDESVKDELIATLKSQMADLRIQLNQEQQRVEEQKDHVATLKRENESLAKKIAELQSALDLERQKNMLDNHLFPTGVADKGKDSRPHV